METKINSKSLFEVIEQTKKDNGITFSVMTGEINPSKGFMVALQDKQLTNKLLEPLTLANYISDNVSFLKWDDYFIGLWLDKETDLWYYDISQIRLDEINAIRLGKRRNQIAIWDNEYKVELRVDANNTRDIMKAIVIGQKYIYINNNFVELPTKQTSGTSTQQATYIELKARELYNKYFTPQGGTNELKEVWDFVERYYPKYSSSDEILRNNDLTVALETADEDEISDLEEQLKDSNSYVYEKAIEGYINSLNTK